MHVPTHLNLESNILLSEEGNKILSQPQFFEFFRTISVFTCQTMNFEAVEDMFKTFQTATGKIRPSALLVDKNKIVLK